MMALMFGYRTIYLASALAFLAACAASPLTDPVGTDAALPAASNPGSTDAGLPASNTANTDAGLPPASNPASTDAGLPPWCDPSVPTFGGSCEVCTIPDAAAALPITADAGGNSCILITVPNWNGKMTGGSLSYTLDCPPNASPPASVAASCECYGSDASPDTTCFCPCETLVNYD